MADCSGRTHVCGVAACGAPIVLTASGWEHVEAAAKQHAVRHYLPGCPRG